jgi:hypothetical protein
MEMMKIQTLITGKNEKFSVSNHVIRRQQGDDRTQLNMFFKEASNQDSLADYLPNNDDAVLER